MKVIIAGPRDYTNFVIIVQAIDYFQKLWPITEVVSGKATGVDTLGEKWAKYNGIPIKDFPADWNKYGFKAAGPIRNGEMVKYADALLAIYDGKSRGTRDVINQAIGHIYTLVWRIKR